MKFVLVDSDKLKVSLTQKDLEEMGISYESIDYSDENTRKALVSLLEKGRAQTGFNPRRAKLYIEVFPSQDGGCVIYYTRLQGGEVFAAGRFVPGPSPVVFAFDSSEALIQACSGAKRRCIHRILRSRLYLLEKQYRLVIWSLDYSDNVSVLFLSEYGRPVGEGAVLAAFTEEHGKLLICENAIETLAELEI